MRAEMNAIDTRGGVCLAGLCKSFTSASGECVDVLRDFDLSIAPGEFICVVGASGCGKSTLLRILAGFERATSGTATVRGALVEKPGPDRGVVFQDYGLFPWLTVADNIGYGLRQRSLPKQRVAEVTRRFTAMVGLERVASQYPHQLSGGMQQRVAIARVLANDPAVLLMDEPFGALDSLTRQMMQDQLRLLCQELKPIVLFITHSVEEAVYLADRAIVMSGGPSHGRPGHISKEVRIPLPHPRDVTSAEFNALKRELLAAIHGGAHAAAATD
jgi:NitT/TauT family transport system ATP-binding protein